MLKLKVCGISDAVNLIQIGGLKPDIIGLNFYKESKRFVKGDLNIEVLNDVELAGVFVDEDLPVVIQKGNQYGLSYIQLHGNESPTYCMKVRDEGFKVIKVFRIDDVFDFSELEPFLSCADYFLFDTPSKEYGGSGKKFNWNVLYFYPYSKPFFLAGGLNPKNVKKAVRLDLPNLCGLDVNSGYEETPGIKSIKKVEELIKLLKNDSYK